jgi:hypothetical protein
MEWTWPAEILSRHRHRAQVLRQRYQGQLETKPGFRAPGSRPGHGSGPSPSARSRAADRGCRGGSVTAQARQHRRWALAARARGRGSAGAGAGSPTVGGPAAAPRRPGVPSQPLLTRTRPGRLGGE